MRVILSKKKQKDLMCSILSRMSVKRAAEICFLSERTIRDWKRAKFSIDVKCLYKLCRLAKIDFPKHCEIRSNYWYAYKSSLAGMKAVYKKYGYIGGNPEYRKKRRQEWWDREGRYISKIIGCLKPIKKPKFSSHLAEFVGIVLGDGSITKNQVRFTLHIEDDKDYGKFIIRLNNKLFDVDVGVYENKKYSATIYYISRKELVAFLVSKLGLKIGNKIRQQVDIPRWIKENKSYSRACVRGLIDTDGSVFTHSYKVNGKVYSYKKLGFTSHSKPLRHSVFNVLKDNGIKSRLFDNRDVRIDSIADMEKYFKIFSSHNPKHLKRYKK
jgi:hypothetical protein